MRRQGAVILLLLCGAGLVVGLVQLFKLRFEAGDIYPPYSSLRADPLGTMAFYEGLAELPGLSLERDYRASNELPAAQQTTYLHLGGDRRDWQSLPEELASEIERFCGSGGRLVVTLLPETAKPIPGWAEDQESDQNRKDPGAKKKREGSDRPSDPSRKKTKRNAKPPRLQARRERWGFELGFVPLAPGVADAYEPVRVVNRTSLALPSELEWHSGVILTNLGPAWQTIYARGSNPVLAELQLGAGSVVLATDSYFLSNEALVKDRHSDLLAWLVGSGTHLFFDEAHFGIVDEAGVATLVRGYRLQWLAAGLLVLAGLYVWKSSVSLAPPYASEARMGHVAGKDSAAGFVNLLRRNLPQRELLKVCLAEWKRAFAQTGSAALAKADQAQVLVVTPGAGASTERDPVRTYQVLCALLRNPSRNPPGPDEPAADSSSSSPTLH
jgi:hypothetical protein